VTLVDSGGIIHQNPIQLDGTFSIAGVPTGTVKIGVHSTEPNYARGQPGAGGGGTGAGSADDPRAKFKGEQAPSLPLPPRGSWFPLDQKFSDPDTSGLTGQVVAGKDLIIDLP
jgi:hypothetical protein